jgi:uncharacterized protein (TIGR03067 family)
MPKLFRRGSFLAVVFCVFAAPLAADEQAIDPKKLEGAYTITTGERDGKPIPEADLTGCTVRITADKIVAADKSGTPFLNVTYTLDTAKKPCLVKMKSTATDAKEYMGLVEREKDTVKIVYHMDGGEAPKEFKTKEKQVLLVMKPKQ